MQRDATTNEHSSFTPECKKSCAGDDHKLSWMTRVQVTSDTHVRVRRTCNLLYTVGRRGNSSERLEFVSTKVKRNCMHTV